MRRCPLCERQSWINRKDESECRNIFCPIITYGTVRTKDLSK